ncbi:MAG TPA: Crp/Fnr family transcriptional regulator [Actinomycetota bacterium]|nr:Crp/Fnr family transcriptional regulator [Actinomycetota bacterium]
MPLDSTAALLARSEIFADLDDEALTLLAERSFERAYRRGQRIFNQGDQAEHLFVVKEGLVKILIASRHGEEMVLATLRARECFGELALIDGGPRSASAEAIGPVRLVVLARSSWLELLHERPSITETLLISMGRMVRRLTEQASDLVLLDVQSRVAKLLMMLADERGQSRDDGLWLDLQLTQSDLASMVGGSRQTVNQALRAFERRGYLEMHGKQIVIRQPDELRRRASL